MAFEPDMFETDPKTGEPAIYEFPYRVIYRWTSHFVHPTVVALKNHVVRPGRDNFVVRSMHLEDLTHVTVFIIATYVSQAMISFYRIMGDRQPDRVSTWAQALIKHLGAPRHR